MNAATFPESAPPPVRRREFARQFEQARREERLRDLLAAAVADFNDDPPVGSVAELDARHRIARLRAELAEVTRPALTRF